MIKRILSIIIIVFPLALHAQEKLNQLKTPSSPASSILGLQPSVVLAPKSYQALETSLFSNFVSSDGSILIPNDFSLEFTPYWAKNHSLSLTEYLYPKSGLDQLIRNSSFSVASTQNYLLGDSSATNGLSYGYRTTFYFGNKKDLEEVRNATGQIRANQSIQAKISALANDLIINNKISNQKELIDTLKIEIYNQLYKSSRFKSAGVVENLTNEIINSLPSLDLENPDPFLDSLDNRIGNKISSELIFTNFKTYIKERYGLSIDVAYAGMVNFPRNEFGFSYVPKQSFWVTPIYRFEDKANFLKVMGVLRYEWYNQSYYKKYFTDIEIYENNLDYGLSVATEFQKFSLNFELVGRNSNSEIPAGTDQEGNELFRKKDKFDVQYLGSFNYNLTDQIILSYSLGKRFEPILDPTHTLVSLLALNFGFGAPTKNDIDFTKE